MHKEMKKRIFEWLHGGKTIGFNLKRRVYKIDNYIVFWKMTEVYIVLYVP